MQKKKKRKVNTLKIIYCNNNLIKIVVKKERFIYK